MSDQPGGQIRAEKPATAEVLADERIDTLIDKNGDGLIEVDTRHDDVKISLSIGGEGQPITPGRRRCKAERRIAGNASHTGYGATEGRRTAACLAREQNRARSG